MAVLDVSDVSVSFGGVKALQSVSLSAQAGAVTGLIGPNGAGKTTLFNVVTGLITPRGGRVLLGGRNITSVPAHRRARLGLTRTFQRLEVFESLTVRENVAVAVRANGRAGTSEPATAVERILDLIGLRAVAEAHVDTLPTGLARLVELARAIAIQPRVLLCDECSSGLTDEETAGVSQVLQRVAAEGVAVVLVEHDMSFVMGNCSRIHVLDFGEKIAEGTPAEIQANPRVRAAYLGNTAEADEPPPEPAPIARPVVLADAPPTAVVELMDVRAGYGGIEVLHGLSLRVGAGEVFALLGPNGAGKSTTLKVINGEVAPTSGDVFLGGRSVLGVPPDTLARAGVCTVPEGRGIFPNLSVDDNLRMSTFLGVPLDQVRERAFRQFPRLRERRGQLAGSLSGGEQQMLALARALAVDPAVLIIDELSMGLAPIIVEQLYEIVAELAASAALAIIIVEQFAHDVLRVATRAGVMAHGRLVTVGPPDQVAATISDAYLARTADELTA